MDCLRITGQDLFYWNKVNNGRFKKCYIFLYQVFDCMNMIGFRHFVVFLIMLYCVTISFSQATRPADSLNVDSLFIQIRQSYDAGFRIEAIAQLAQVKQLIQERFERESSVYSSACFLEGTLLSNSGDYSQAEAAYLESKEIRGLIFNNHSVEYMEVLSRLSMLRSDMGKYKEAAQCVEELKEIRELALQPDDPRLISTVRQLGTLYRQMGTYELADSIFQAQSIDETRINAQAALEYARLLAEMADLYSEMEDFERALPTYIKALSLYETKKSKESGDYVALLTGLAHLYFEMGQLDESQVYLVKAKKQVETGFLFNRKIKYGPVMLALAELHRANSEFEDAEELYLDGIEEFESNLQQGYPDYAKLHYELASLYHESQDYARAEETYAKAIQLWRAMEGARVPWYPKTMMGLAKLYQENGNYEKAISLFLQSKQYWEATLGVEYPLYIINILDLARLSWEKRQYSSADSLYAMAAELGKKRLVGAAQYMSARELHRYMQKVIDTQAEILSFVSQSPVHNQTSGTCYDNALFYKGFLLQNAIRIKRAALANAGSAAVYHQLNANRRLLSKEFTKPFAERKNVKGYQHIIDSLELELICMVGEVEELAAQVHWQEVASLLDSNEIAIEFMHFRSYNRGLTDSINYSAIVLQKDDLRPTIISLFTVHKNDQIIRSLGLNNIEFIQSLYSLETRGLVLVDDTKPNLYEMIWAPIIQHGLAGVERIYCSPSGILHRLNLGAIPANTGSLIADQYDLINVGSTRGIKGLKSLAQDSISRVAIFGGIRFDYKTVDESIRKSDQVPSLPIPEFQRERGDLDGSWNYLIGTEKEALTLSEVCLSLGIPSDTYTDSFATEEVFKRLGDIGYPPSPWLLHVGTHGFFFPDPETRESDHLFERKVIFTSSEQPMLRSGLILAGANFFWQNHALPPGELEDGVLTADEISHLDLSHTELAVLSACETGLGDIRGSEGVYGLQRAFKIAGVNQLIMSLWKIPDKPTQKFMDYFYQFWLVDKKSIREAFKETQKKMQEFYDHYEWASFILLSH